jgi:Tfp pilus assembly protein PilV
MIRRAFHHRRRDRQGMVLFEVVIALVVFSVVALSLVTALDSSFDAERDRDQIDAAVRGLNNQIALLHASRVLTGDRDLPDDGSGFLYHVSCDQVTLTDQKQVPLQNMFNTTITITWKEGADTQSRSVSELLYQP